MVAAKNKLNQSLMIPSGKVSNPSTLWQQISKPLLHGNNYHNFFISRFGHSLGNGVTISFWNDDQLENSTLVVLFPKIYTLEVGKKAIIASLGQWINYKLCCDIKLCRQPLSWETNQWTNFMSFIKGIQPHSIDMDKVIWKNSTNGQYLFSSFYNSCQILLMPSLSLGVTFGLVLPPLKLKPSICRFSLESQQLKLHSVIEESSIERKPLVHFARLTQKPFLTYFLIILWLGKFGPFVVGNGAFIGSLQVLCPS